MHQTRGQTNYHAGHAAEGAVVNWYVRKGAAVTRKRYRQHGGEVDVIVQDGDVVVFVEVKCARTHAEAASRVRPAQMRRISNAAAGFLDTLPNGALTPARFDVALVDASGAVSVLENAFHAA